MSSWVSLVAVLRRTGATHQTKQTRRWLDSAGVSPLPQTQIGLPGYASMPAALAAMTRQERATYCNGHWGQEWRKLYTLEFSR